MSVDDAEVVFGKRWNKWTIEERMEFVGALEPEDLNIPMILKMAYDNIDLLQSQTRTKMDEYIDRRG